MRTGGRTGASIMETGGPPLGGREERLTLGERTGMRLLHFGDLHLDTPFRWAGPGLARRRRQSLRDTLRTLLDLAASTRVDAVLCAGDLYAQDYFSPDTAAFLRHAFARLHPLPIYIAPAH